MSTTYSRELCDEFYRYLDNLDFLIYRFDTIPHEIITKNLAMYRRIRNARTKLTMRFVIPTSCITQELESTTYNPIMAKWSARTIHKLFTHAPIDVVNHILSFDRRFTLANGKPDITTTKIPATDPRYEMLQNIPKIVPIDENRALVYLSRKYNTFMCLNYLKRYMFDGTYEHHIFFQRERACCNDGTTIQPVYNDYNPFTSTNNNDEFDY